MTPTVERFKNLTEDERIILIDCLKVRLTTVKGMQKTLVDMQEQRGLSRPSQEMLDRYESMVLTITKLLAQLR